MVPIHNSPMLGNVYYCYCDTRIYDAILISSPLPLTAMTEASAEEQATGAPKQPTRLLASLL